MQKSFPCNCSVSIDNISKDMATNLINALQYQFKSLPNYSYTIKLLEKCFHKTNNVITMLIDYPAVLILFRKPWLHNSD